MRDKIIGWSLACCFVFGTLYLKNKIFNKKLVVEQLELEDLPDSEKVE